MKNRIIYYIVIALIILPLISGCTDTNSPEIENITEGEILTAQSEISNIIETTTESTTQEVTAEEPATTEPAGPVLVPASDFEYTVGEDGGVIVEKYNGNDENIIIPDTIDNKSVTSIEQTGFQGCKNLKSIYIPSGITNIGSRIFWECPNLYAIEVSADNPEYSSVDGVLFNKYKTVLLQYPAGNIRTDYTTPNSVKTIDDAAFNYCQYLIDLSVSDSVTDIAQFAFVEGVSIRNIFIGSGVETIEYRAFINTINLLSITVSENNSNFVSIDGVLYNKNKTQLIQYPGARAELSYIIPNGITCIEGYAFHYCRNLENITFPDGLEEIGYASFEECSKITKIVLPETLKTIDMWAFKHGGIEEITIPAGVVSISGHAFECYELRNITILAKDIDISEDAFYGVSNLTIHGYKGSSVETYAKENNFKFVEIE